MRPEGVAGKARLCDPDELAMILLAPSPSSHRLIR